MKKLFLAIPIIALGCASVTRDPAAFKNGFHFNLFGQNPRTNTDYKFELVNIDRLAESKVEFQTISKSDGDADSMIKTWHKNLRTLRDRTGNYNSPSKYVFQFEFNKIPVSVEKDDLKLIDQTLSAVDSEKDSDLRLRKKIEIVTAFNERFKESMDQNIETLTLPFEALSRISTPSIPVTDGPIPQIHPSSFWAPGTPGDLIRGHGKMDPQFINEVICNYSGPKKGYGVHAGFKVECLGHKLKVKFGNEVHSGPFNSRIYNRLGFNVPALHYIPALKVQYQREILSEINSRKKKAWHINFAGQNVKDIERLKMYDTLDFVAWAHLKDRKTQIKGGLALKKRLLKSTACKNEICTYSDETINKAFEEQIAYLEFKPSSITEPIGEELGAWSFDLLDHPQRTEIKSLMVLGAWTGNFDLRKDNTNLVLLPDGNLKHFISDPGSGLGLSRGILRSGSKVGDMSWDLTLETFIQDSDQPRKNMVGLKYKPIEENEAFRKISFQDAQWMVSRIAEISEDEISRALFASGLSAAEFVLAREKLVANQQGLIEHFGLKSQFPSKFDRTINKRKSFDPAAYPDGRIKIKLSDQSLLVFPTRNVKLVNGQLIYPPGLAPAGL